VSTIKELTRRWYPGALETVPRKATAHRALDDIRESITELRWYREQVFRLPAEVVGALPPSPPEGDEDRN
jgi:oligoribonuclease